MRLTLTADDIDDATDLALSGPGVTVRWLPATERGQLDTLLSIAIDAPPGWRDIEVVIYGRLRRLVHAFEIVDPLAYSGGGLGIGSHLI